MTSNYFMNEKKPKRTTETATEAVMIMEKAITAFNP
jgi:hypothetical protein